MSEQEEERRKDREVYQTWLDNALALRNKMIELKIPRDDSWNQIDEDIRLARALLKAIDEGRDSDEEFLATVKKMAAADGAPRPSGWRATKPTSS